MPVCSKKQSIAAMLSVAALWVIVSVSKVVIGQRTSADDHENQSCSLRYSLLALPPGTGGGVTLSIGIDEESSRFPETTGVRAVVGSGFCPATWHRIEPLSSIESLVHHGDVTNEDLRCLAAFPQLEVLRLNSKVHREIPRDGPRMWPGRRPPYSAVALGPITGMKRLRELSLASDSLKDEGLEIVKVVPELLSLKLAGFFTNEALRHVGELRELRRLSLTGDFDDEGLRLLTRLVNLESLELESAHLRGPGLVHLAALPRLRFLRIAKAIPDLSLCEIEKLPVLQVLDLGTAGVTDDILSTLPSLPRLKSLSVNDNPISNQGLTAFTRLTNLTELNLRNTLITNAGIEIMTKHEPFQRHLRVLCLGERNVYNSPPAITQAGLAHLSSLSELEALDLRYINLTDVDLQVLALPSLRRLNVEGLSQDPQNVQLHQLQQRLPLLNRNLFERIRIRADLFREAELMKFDFTANRFKIIL